MKRRRFYPILAVLLCLTMAAQCDDEAGFTTADKQKVVALFSNGISFEDPFVRAETLRVINLIDEPELFKLAVGNEKDDESMVRLIALRVLLRSKHESARSTALNAFSRGNSEERRAVLEAAFELGDPALRAELSARAFRGDDTELKRMAFERGYLARVDEALAAKKTKLLERTLLPDLGRFVSEKDPILAALALRKLVKAGQPERADRLLKQVLDKNESANSRLLAATILSRAKIPQANDAFRTLRDKYDAALTNTSLHVPGIIVPPKIVKWAVLGLAASGGSEEILRANKYRIDSDVQTSLDVLDSFSENPNQDALIALKNAMSDARSVVRRRAIELYLLRKDANAKSLVNVLSSADQATRVRIFRALIDRFSAETVPLLELRVKRTSEVDLTLDLLCDVIKTKADAEKILTPLVPSLKKLNENKKESRAQKSRYLVAIANTTEVAPPALLETLSDNMIYGYLEFALTTSPALHKDIYRRYSKSDLYAIRLISGAGLITAK